MRPRSHTTNNDTALPTYVTLEQAAQITEQSIKTIRRRIADGTLPAYRFGGRNIRIKLDELEASARLIPNARNWEHL